MQNIVNVSESFSKLCNEYVTLKREKTKLKRRLRRLRGSKREPLLKQLRELSMKLYRVTVQIEIHPDFKLLTTLYSAYKIWREVIPRIAKQYSEEVNSNEQ